MNPQLNAGLPPRFLDSHTLPRRGPSGYGTCRPLYCGRRRRHCAFGRWRRQPAALCEQGGSAPRIVAFACSGFGAPRAAQLRELQLPPRCRPFGLQPQQARFAIGHAPSTPACAPAAMVVSANAAVSAYKSPATGLDFAASNFESWASAWQRTRSTPADGR